MIQEYLFSDKTKRADVKKYKPQNVDIHISNIKNSECWTISYSVPRDDESAAKILSGINEHIVATFHPIVLTNESAAYFNKTLYPLINEFERKLRKLLYFKSALNPGDKASENIKDLEQKDLGKIFELLFADEQFVKTIKRKVSQEMTWTFTKAELLKVIDIVSENTVWDHLIGEEAVPALRGGFLSVKDYRNDIMHAHNINYTDYRKSKSLFKKINKEIDTEIGLIVAVAEKPSVQHSALNYNAALNEALQNMKLAYAAGDYARQISAIQMNISSALLQMQEAFSRLPKLSPEHYETMLRLSEAMKAAQPSPEWQAMLKSLSDIPQVPQPSQEALDAIRRLSEEPVLGRGDSDESDETTKPKSNTDEDEGTHDKRK